MGRTFFKSSKSQKDAIAAFSPQLAFTRFGGVSASGMSKMKLDNVDYVGHFKAQELVNVKSDDGTYNVDTFIEFITGEHQINLEALHTIDAGPGRITQRFQPPQQ